MTPPTSAAEVTIDLDTRAVTITGADAKLGWLLKRGDDSVAQIRFVRRGVAADLDLTSLKFGMKDDEGETPPVVLGTAFAKFGTGTGAFYRAYVRLDVEDDFFTDPANPESDAALDRSAIMGAIAEFEWVEANTLGVGPGTLRSTSQSFRVSVIRDLVANA